MYTSGSTGKPKGVMIKHSNMVAALGALTEYFKDFTTNDKKEVYLAFLPAAHILEFALEIGMLVMVNAQCPARSSNTGIRA